MMFIGLNLNPDYLDNLDMMISSDPATSTLLVVNENTPSID